ncbi:MAG: RNA polymerase sigma factor [Fluviicola sp.]|jgi:RNA polymerase sigma-70 factor (ECF subfamily)
MAVNPYFHQTPDKLREELVWLNEAKKNPQAFSPLYKKYHMMIHRYVQQRIQDEDQTHDIVAQVFMKALKNLHTYEFRGVPFCSWLFRIAKSEMNQFFRENDPKRKVSMDHIQIATFDTFSFDWTEYEMIRKRLQTAMGQIKTDQLRLIEMRFFEQLSFKEIGEELGMTENNAKVKTFRALEKLKIIFHQPRNVA